MKVNMKKVPVYIVLGFFSAIQIFPLLWLVNYSFKNNTEIFTKSPLAFAEHFNAGNYITAWVKGSVGKYFMNSLFVSFFSVLITLLLGCMIGYGITRMFWKMKNAVLAFIMLGMMIPIHATLIPLFILMQNMGMLNSRWAIIIPYIAAGMPLAVFTISNFMRSIPRELEEAAFIDGCGVFRSFAQIIMPSLKPIMATVSIFCFMNNWNEFIMASTYLQSSELYTLPIGLRAFKGQYTAELAPMAACIVIASIPLLIFYCFFSEQVEKSFAAGSGLK